MYKTYWLEIARRHEEIAKMFRDMALSERQINIEKNEERNG